MSAARSCCTSASQSGAVVSLPESAAALASLLEPLPCNSEGGRVRYHTHEHSTRRDHCCRHTPWQNVASSRACSSSSACKHRLNKVDSALHVAASVASTTVPPLAVRARDRPVGEEGGGAPMSPRRSCCNQRRSPLDEALAGVQSRSSTETVKNHSKNNVVTSFALSPRTWLHWRQDWQRANGKHVRR